VHQTQMTSITSPEVTRDTIHIPVTSASHQLQLLHAVKLSYSNWYFVILLTAIGKIDGDLVYIS
jgi:hypothetical protein